MKTSMGTRTVRILPTLLSLATVVGCQAKYRADADPAALEATEDAGEDAREDPSSNEAVAPNGVETTAAGEDPSAVGSIDSSGVVNNQSGKPLAPEPCSADAGACLSDAGASPVCEPSGPRDCSSDRDNDCNGRPDNEVDDTCRCIPGAIEACEEHPGLDGRGPCRAGTRTCIAGEGNATSDWSTCEGSVGPGAQDSCTIAGDDTDCNGAPNSGCECVDGQTQPCGPTEAVGSCRPGTSTCMGAEFRQCVGAVFPAARDSCAIAGDDSNCNGIANEGCGCIDGETQGCGGSDIGNCQLGTQTCVNGAFQQCVGAVSPGPRNCASPQDNDCNGQPDNTIDSVCQCVIGTTQACGTHPQDGTGQCRAGEQRCNAGPNNSSSSLGNCTGSVGPAQQDSCSVDGDDANCNGDDNDRCQCIGQDNSQCSGNPNASRCNGNGQCVPCQADGDCSLVSGGRSVCDNGSCVAAVEPFECTVAQFPPQVDDKPESAVPDVSDAPTMTGGEIRDGEYVMLDTVLYGISAQNAQTEHLNIAGQFLKHQVTLFSLTDPIDAYETVGTFTTTGSFMLTATTFCSFPGPGLPGEPTAETWNYTATGDRLEILREFGGPGALQLKRFIRQ